MIDMLRRAFSGPVRTIDIVNQVDGQVDGNWSGDDIAAATNNSVVRNLIEQRGLTGKAVVDLATTVSSVAQHLAQTDDLWEQLVQRQGFVQER